ncbi:hypothetical protein PPACK8108_LOCUS8760 [Phakopsora pachyrhizi]|uniref:Uncharacterized protein n=1 Tax=Phakopsora pachyrhizi TaxID=170000 RepID=A0AAV0AV81_PHAPC|nr:hypothetical protein PPACK8108_LOCUS8760 [Phakopsora pachyrhizi]
MTIRNIRQKINQNRGRMNSEETLRQSHKTSEYQKLTSTTANLNPKPEPEMRSSKKEVVSQDVRSPIYRWSYQLPFINHFETIHTGPLVSLISHGGLSVGLSLRESL